ncbi:MAG: tetratricopeptide repeat protein [Candidatus Omnitrophica bacterium]|nr:tetratricopeptide repeat protein [Candidatus Omnitrophota bacterium]
MATFFKNRTLSILAIFLLTAAVYSNIFANQFLMDDWNFIVDWPLIQDWKNFPQFFIGYVPPAGQEGIYSPLKTLFHAVNYSLFGLNPLGYHIVSLVVHLTGIFLVYKLSYLFIKDERIAFFSALLFGLHPVHVEPVTSMTGSVDLIGVLFMFLAFYLYVKAQRSEEGFNRKLYTCSLLTAFLSIFTHELCLSLPILLLWYDLCFTRQERSYRQMASRVAPFFIIAVFYALCKFLVLGSVTRGQYIYDSFYLTMLVMVKALAKYVVICFAPTVLTHNQIIAPGISSFDQADFDKFTVLSQSPLEARTFLFLVLLGAIAYFAYLKFPKERLITFCVGWFFICLLPVLQIIPSGVYFAERYLYPGTWAFCLLLAFYLRRMMQADRKFLARVGVILLIWMCVLYAARVWIRNRDWKDEITFYEAAARTNGQSALMRNDLGIIYTKYGQPHQALASFQNALRIRPDDPVTYFSMAQAYIQLDDKKKAADALEQAIILNPRYAEAHYNLAGLCIFAGQKDKGIEHFQKALSLSREQGNEQEARKWDKAFKDFFRIPTVKSQ